ncbi:VTC domain-containing protein [Radiomyces spectabilis]|uniref:VTC domain-containing protein n=1 Tax=Radiomyces spectabilis TaxID=64574 RepID=UPI00221F802B|nr:VTC domain-containing protein [Radiomyces spectabilis]KAI8366828.1 VTC domain-containing protein [Radiomyces spectabilis]
MKFGQELQDNVYEPWRFEYVAYDAIKKDMRHRQETHGWTDQDEKDFEATLRLEADKVDLFITRKQREIDSRIAYCERILVQQRPNMTQSTLKGLYESMDDALTDILMDLNDLSKFTRYNYLAFQKLIKKHDKYTHIDRQQLFVDIIRSKPLDRQRFDVALVKISSLHDLCRLSGEARTGNAAAGADQNAFERATAKYWVHPDNVTELKAILLFHLPVLVFNPNKPIEPTDSAISSVYMDNADFDLYNGRLQRDEAAEAIRLRWYGPMDTPHAFVERKTHHAPWLNGVSVKDRFRLEVDKMQDYLSLQYTADQYASELRAQGTPEATIDANYFIASGVQKSIQEKHLEPVMRVFYNRTAFQIPGDQRLRISLDTDLTFVREDADRRQGTWRRPDMGIDYPFDYLPDSDVYRFPYAVLETKLQTHLGQEPPEWLTRLLDSRLVYEVPRFSKYLQGAAYFWRPQLPLLPWWLSELQLDIRNAKQSSLNFTGLSRSKSLKPLIDGRYRMGYLEKQLEKRATLRRADSKKANGGAVERSNSTRQQRQPLTRPSQPSTSTPSGQPGNYGVTLSDNPNTQQGNPNPFDDPFWSQQDTLQFDLDHHSQQSQPNSYLDPGNGMRNRSTIASDRRLTDHFDTSSTEYLVGGRQTPRSSYMHTSPNVKPYSTDPHRDSLFGEDVIAAEAGMATGPNKKKEKKEKKEKEGEGEGGAGGGKKKKDKKNPEEAGARLEPKIFFANERTFINWLQFAAFILTAALTLLNFGDRTSQIAGGTFFAISLILALYAFFRYRYRAYQISNRPHLRYDDLYGPIGLCVLVVGAMILNFTLRMINPSQTTSYLGINNSTRQQT